MWKEIDNESIVKLLTPGTIVMKRLSDNPGLEDSPNFIRYQIASRRQIAQDYCEFDLSIPSDEIPDIPMLITGMKVTGVTSNQPVLHKNSDELIREGVWWYEQ
jgi:hypothetical protein